MNKNIEFQIERREIQIYQYLYINQYKPKILSQQQIKVAKTSPHFSTQAYIFETLSITLYSYEHDPSHLKFIQFKNLPLHKSKQSLSYIKEEQDDHNNLPFIRIKTSKQISLMQKVQYYLLTLNTLHFYLKHQFKEYPLIFHYLRLNLLCHNFLYSTQHDSTRIPQSQDRHIDTLYKFYRWYIIHKLLGNL
ncbi:unnamed protein product [Paramecium sonneborni]|uniref:Uncharacterized protein n=1 Tax=Paramecium sonneborni TaxID=65129 RepID=A0A8S1Q4K8_9CILI|nr:unnamed protein product [Paramecium sonneborni]